MAAAARDGLTVAVRRYRVSLGAVTALGVVEAGLVAGGPELRARVAAAASTNLDNLTAGRLDTLLTSALVTDTGLAWLWLPPVAALLVAVERLVGTRRLLVALATSHVGATLLVGVGLAVGVATGGVGAGVASSVDVGVSYAVAGALGLVAAALPRPLAWAWAVAWLAVAGQSVLVGADFTAVGHLLALAIGTALAAAGPARRPLDTSRAGLLAAVGLALGGVYGLGAVGGAAPHWWSVPLVVALGALVGLDLARRTASTPAAPR